MFVLPFSSGIRKGSTKERETDKLAYIMKNSTIAIEGVSKQYRNELIERIERAAHKSGSWIVDLALNANKGISLLIETKADRLGTLYDCLKATQLGLEENAKSAFRSASGSVEQPNGVLVNLNVRFELNQSSFLRDSLEVKG